MSKKKKYVFSVVVITFIILVIALILYLYTQTKYSLEAVSELVSSAKRLSNMHVSYDVNRRGENIVTDIYAKDNFYYIVSKNNTSSEMLSECYYNPDTSEFINIQNSDPKSIHIFSNVSQQDVYDEYFNHELFFLENHDSQEFKFLGREEIEGKQCIKVCFMNNEIEKTYYYIDLKDDHIVKEETFNYNENNEWEEVFEATYEYSYNTVTDDDVKKFDSNNYPDYITTEIEDN